MATTTLTSGSSQAAQTPRPTAPPGRPVHRPRRRWIGVLVLLALLLITAGIVSALVLDQRLSAGARPVASGGPTGSASPTAPSGPITVRGALEFDPQGDPPTENPDEVAFSYDGDPKTRWRTLQYLRNPKLGGIKRGVGLVFDLGAPQPVREVRLTLSGNGTDVELRVPAKELTGTSKPPMTSDQDWRSVAKQSQAGATATLTASEPLTTRYVLVYLTSLPKEGQGYRGGIYEVEVR